MTVQAVSLVKGTAPVTAGAGVTALVLAVRLLAHVDQWVALADAVSDAVQAVTMIVGS